MKAKAMIPLVLGLVVGIVAVKGFLNVLKRAKAADTETVQVVRARADIPATVEITKEMLQAVEVPKVLAPRDTFASIDEVATRVSGQNIPAGVPITQNLLAPPGTRPGLGALIPEGYRAYAIKVNEIVGVAGWIKPGSKVDIMMVYKPTRTGRTISKTLLQNIEVLAVGQKNVAQGPKATVERSVTVLVTPEQAARINLAADKAKLHLAMRNSSDDEDIQPAVITDSDLMSDDGADKQKAAAGFAQSVLSGLFGNEPKSPDTSTDKENRDAVALAAAAPAPVDDSWRVDVLSGKTTVQLRFDSDRKDARPVSAKVSSEEPAPSASTPRRVETGEQAGSRATGFPIRDASELRQAVAAGSPDGDLIEDETDEFGSPTAAEQEEVWEQGLGLYPEAVE